jgi:hypothetical protein
LFLSKNERGFNDPNHKTDIETTAANERVGTNQEFTGKGYSYRY